MNDAPLAVADTVSTDEDTAVTLTPIDNDGDVDGDALSLLDVGAAAHGTAVIQGSTILYTPQVNFNGTDVFTYTISDGEYQDTAVITVTVNPINDEPTALADVATTDEETAVTTGNVLLNDSDLDGDLLMVSGMDATGTLGQVTNNNNGTFGYDPDGQFEWLAAGETAGDSFVYTVSDGQGGSDTAVVTMTISGVNDAPVALNDTADTPEDTPRTIAALGNDSDPDLSDALMLTAVAIPANGTALISGTFVLYTPTLNFTGVDVFTYTLSDGLLSDTAVVTVTVGEVNDPPDAVADAAATDEDIAVLVDVRANDTDPEGDTLSLIAVGVPGNGTAVIQNGMIFYTPDANFYGADVFTYTVSDGEYSDTAVVQITVNSINDAPVATADTAATDEATAILNVPILANDFDIEGDAMSVIELDTSGTMGQVVMSGEFAVAYSPMGQFEWLAVGETATDSFHYTIADSAGLTATAVVTLTIHGINDAPIALADTADILEDTSHTLAVLGNDSDPDRSDVLVVTAVGDPVNGKAVTDGTLITYTPELNFYGLDVFTYTISDGIVTATALVTVTVQPVNDTPVAADDAAETYGGQGVLVDVLANDADPVEGDALTISSVEAPAHGTVIIVGSAVLYTPEAGFVGVESFTYTISDGIDTAIATVTVNVKPYLIFMPVVWLNDRS